MENLTPDQRNQLEITQFKDFMSTFNQVTESCFTDCVNDFTTRRLTKQEADCALHCMDKYIKMTQRLSLRLQEHMQMQQTLPTDDRIITRTGTLSLSFANRPPPGRQKRRLDRPTAESMSKPKASTIGTQFRSSLQVLFEKLNQANPHFVLCIKPNHSKAPNIFDDKCVAYQLKYAGILDTIYMRKEGFAVRLNFQEFVKYYSWLVGCVTMDGTPDNCRKILASAKLHGYEIGKTKVFLKYWQVDKLNKLVTSAHNAAIMIQKLVRGFICRRRMRRLRKQIGRKTSIHIDDTEVVTDYEDEDDVACDEDGDVFIARKPSSSKFGMEGTKEASHQWFKATQTAAVRNDKGEVYTWFHGLITRHQTEQKLAGRQNGTFLMRVSESRFGFSLSLRSRMTARCKHYLIRQTDSGKYFIDGGGQVQMHTTLEALVNYYHKCPITVDGDILTLVCRAH